MLNHDVSKTIFTLNKVKNSWRKTKEFQESKTYQNTMDELRSYFLDIEWDYTPVIEVDEYFKSVIRKKYSKNDKTAQLHDIIEFLDFVNYLNYKHGVSPMLGKTRLYINELLELQNKSEE